MWNDSQRFHLWQIRAAANRRRGREVLVASCGKPESDDPLHFVASRLLDLRFEAQRRAVVLACEVGRPYLVAALEAREFFDRVNSPFVGASVNPARFACDQDAADYVTEMTHRI